MAKRPVFIPMAEPTSLVKEIMFEFPWHSGFAAVQKKKNVTALHLAAEQDGLFPLLEVSTKSEEKLGQRLSAFNLQIDTTLGKISIESAFQGSKVFRDGGPFHDLYLADSLSAKRDERLKTSGPLTEFNFFGQIWPLNPKTAFYDWLYLTALQPHQDFLKRLYHYKGFSDIEFNPEKSINCQARTCALLVSLLKMNMLNDALRSQSDFIAVLTADSANQPKPSHLHASLLI